MASRRRRTPTLLSVVVVALASAMTIAAGCSSTDSDGSSSSSSVAASGTGPASTDLAVEWIDGYQEPGTPAEFNKVGVLKVGDRDAPNVVVLEPGTSGGSTYFVPLATDIVEARPTWQVWSVERRQNLFEDQSKLTDFKRGGITSTDLFNFYLGYLKDPAITDHFQSVGNDTVAFAKQWGVEVAVEDLRVVIDQAAELKGKVVLGGHSLGGSLVTAFATWDFDGEPGAALLDGLVYIDGGSRPTAVSESQATDALNALNAPDASPWLSFGGIPAPYAGIFNATGSATSLLDPVTMSLGQTSGLLPADIVPPVPATNQGQYGFALNVGTSPATLAAAQGHLGTGLNDDGTWNSAGAISPIDRYATMFSGPEVTDADGTEWYFPQRLTNDTQVIANGNANPAQKVLGVDATLGNELPEDLFIYAFGASLGGAGVTTTAQQLAQQSGIPADHLSLVDRSATYAHNDPAGAAPENEFLAALLPFLTMVGDS